MRTEERYQKKLYEIGVIDENDVYFNNDIKKTFCYLLISIKAFLM